MTETKREDGGAAFPGPSLEKGPYGEKRINEGMSLRDYFAAVALQGMSVVIAEFTGKEWATDMAKQAYQLADAMLSERGKP